MWLGIALGGLGLWGQGAEDPSAAILDLMADKLAASFTAPSTLGTGPAYLLLTPMGIPVTPEQTQDPYDLSVLLDQVPLPSRQYALSGTTYSDLYQTILNKATVSRYQNQADLGRVRKLKLLMFDRRRHGKPTANYAAYLKYQAAYARALDAQSLAQVENQASGKGVPPGLDAAVNKTLKEWTILGSKRLFEDALANADSFYNSNIRLIFSDLNDDMLTEGINDSHPSQWFPVTASPSIDSWLAPDGWVSWSFQTTDLHGAGPRAKLPPASQGQAQAAPVNAQWVGSMAMSAQLKRVSITRPWMDLKIFRSHAWSLSGSGAFTTVATGNPMDPQPGFMPIIVTGVLLAKDLVLTGSWGSAAAQAQAPTALGPFALASTANAKGLPLHPYVSTDEDGTLSIKVDGTQIIGFFCEATPKAPTPDPTLFR
jgi:hypothetical protein